MIRLHGIPLYWGIETDAPDRTFFTRAFLNEALPPYRESNKAIRIRVSHRHWLHIGIHRFKTEIVKRYGLDDIEPHEIGGWGLEYEVEEEGPADLDWDEVRPSNGERSDQLH